MTAKSAPIAAARPMDNWYRLQPQQSRMQRNHLRHRDATWCTVCIHIPPSKYILCCYFLSSNVLLWAEKYQQLTHQTQDVLSSVDFCHTQPQTQSQTQDVLCSASTTPQSTTKRCTVNPVHCFMIQPNMNMRNALEVTPIEKTPIEQARSKRE